VREPESRYAVSGDVRLAYQTIGEGPLDLIFVAGGQFPIDLIWEHPSAARLLQRLASFSRVVLIEPRGWGASRTDVGLPAPTAEAWADDFGLVMDAVGIERAAIAGFFAGAFFSMFFAASHPECVTKLVLLESFARVQRDDDYPAGIPSDVFEAGTQQYFEDYGSGASIAFVAPSLRNDEPTRRWWGRCERLANNPEGAVKYWRELASRDGRSVLPNLHVPTLVLHRHGDPFIPVAHGRYVAKHIPDAKYVELPGADHWFFLGDIERLGDEIEAFITGSTANRDIDRKLASVLYTDIVASTEHLVAVGDRRWRELLDLHESLTRSAVTRFRGRVIKSTGDGALATFDGPARAIRCAQELCDGARQLDLSLRCGIHTGEIEERGDDIGGIAVHLAARVQTMAQGDEVLVSRTVTELVAGSGIAFDDRGHHELKGIPGQWHLFAVSPRR
jgi:class 3 adenylate cyclase/pimeloyl-ACP methyl ester carboxylesterase